MKTDDVEGLQNPARTRIAPAGKGAADKGEPFPVDVMGPAGQSVGMSVRHGINRQTPAHVE